jgi:hypothetical protein
MQLAIAGQPRWLFAASLLPLLGIGLWLRQHIARILALIILWFVAVVVPLVMFNPFAALDGVYGPSSTPPGQIILQPLPWVVASFFAIYILGKYKHEFRWWRGPAA